MWTIIERISLLRYLIVLRVNAGFVHLPARFSEKLSRRLLDLILSRLPQRDARAWRRNLDAWRAPDPGPAGLLRPAAASPWLIDAVLLAAPTKRLWSAGEMIFWELKLFGDRADHAFFLETFLPALEELSYSRSPSARERRALWGRFDIVHVFAARGSAWEPVVQDGELDLHCRPSPRQWLEGWACARRERPVFRRIDWFAGVDLRGVGPPSLAADGVAVPPPSDDGRPNLFLVVEALSRRLSDLTCGLSAPADAWLADLPPSARDGWEEVRELARLTLPTYEDLRREKDTVARWRGLQIFDAIPPALVPWLDVASILHIGRDIHFGCGSLRLS